MADIIEILQEIGSDKLGCQRLSSVLDGNQQRMKGGGTRLSFATDQDLGAVAFSGTRDALIIWMDSKDLDDALARIRAREGDRG